MILYDDPVFSVPEAEIPLKIPIPLGLDCGLNLGVSWLQTVFSILIDIFSLDTGTSGISKTPRCCQKKREYQGGIFKRA